ncbi:MAG: DUF951 domain-containing protein [Clostridia bacterium]|nr:DUF951 domain-containing protein [Clostridia bacterium]MBQ2152389.1 DUF951 domain-containing protein [Clostridia bacterium]MBQ2347593.1 DUF951 domain-containing protein [Clostridia bacterium]MBQ5439478.1 DUF951 domain-containing protein [Clostridia bacterium]
MKVSPGDILEMKKPHPCGDKRFKVHRIGIEFRLECMGCGRIVIVPRIKIEKNIKKIISDPKEH